jgi:hypothetical protein
MGSCRTSWLFFKARTTSISELIRLERAVGSKAALFNLSLFTKKYHASKDRYLRGFSAREKQ